MKEVNVLLNNIRDIAKELEVIYKNAKEKSMLLDRMLSQIYHEFEFENLDAIGMSKKSKELKGVLKLRRKYKNDMESMQAFRGRLAFNTVCDSINNYNKSVSGQDKKKFKTRVTAEVRKELLKEIETMK